MRDDTGQSGPEDTAGRTRPDGQGDASVDGPDFTLVRRGESPALVAAYRSAVRQAGELATAMTTAGLGKEVIDIVPSVDRHGRPLVRGALTLAGARRLARFLADGHEPPPVLGLYRGHPDSGE